MNNYVHLVNEAAAQLGPLRSNNPEDWEANKAKLTRRAAWLIYQQDPNIGLFRKTSGNNVMGLSVDLVIDRRTGDFADVASDRDDGGGYRSVVPLWIPNAADGNTSNPTAPSSQYPNGRWQEPTAALAGVDDQPTPQPNPNPDPGQPPAPVVDAAALDARLSRMEAALEWINKRINPDYSGTARFLGTTQTIVLHPKEPTKAGAKAKATSKPKAKKKAKAKKR